jgi:mRNA-degrading endonuclease RelE of RelBE toxin-antitoxin system
MPYGLVATDGYSKDLKRIRKKYARAEKDIQEFLEKSLLQSPRSVGDYIPRTPQVYKVRVGLPSHRIDKRGGLRLLYQVDDKTETVLLVMLFHKSDVATVTAAEVLSALNSRHPTIDAIRRRLLPDS